LDAAIFFIKVRELVCINWISGSVLFWKIWTTESHRKHKVDT